MTIRQRLIFFLLLIMFLLGLMGSLLFLGAPLFLNSFKKSLDAMESLSTIRSLRTHVNRQQVSLNRYILIDEEQELLNYEEATSAVDQILLDVQRSPKIEDWFKDTKKSIDDIHGGTQQIIHLCKKGEKQRAIDEASNKLFPKFSKLNDTINNLEKSKATDAIEMYKSAKTLSETAGWSIFTVLSFAFLFGAFLMQSLYRSLMKPLDRLKKGTDEFGKGHWDYRIEISSSNEFGLLAKSFNQMAENVKQLQQQAIHMDRMSAVGQLAGGVAHELNNPLTGVLGQAQILLSKLNETDMAYPQLKKIEQAALRCKKIVRGLLDFSRPSQSKFDEVSLNDLLDATTDLCEADMKSAKVSLNKKFSSTLSLVIGNASELQQVILNLISNAIHAMSHGGGMLTLETLAYFKTLTLSDRRKGSPVQEVAGNWVEVIIRDTGIGISKDHIGHIFEPFFTTKEIGQGTGLGLSVSMGIIRKHGGNIVVDSAGLNKGASFHVILPAKGNPGPKFQ